MTDQYMFELKHGSPDSKMETALQQSLLRGHIPTVERDSSGSMTGLNVESDTVKALTRAQYADQIAPRYPGYHTAQPLRSIVVASGTSAINYGASAGATVVLTAVDTANKFHGRACSTLSIDTAGTGTFVHIGRSTQDIALNADGIDIINRSMLFAAKIIGNTSTKADLLIGDSTQANKYEFTLRKVSVTPDGWTIYAKNKLGADVITGTPAPVIAAGTVRAHIRFTMSATVAVGSVTISPLWVLPVPKKSLVLTMDDGHDNWVWCADEAAKRGVPMTFAINSGNIGNQISEATVRQLATGYDGFHDVVNHKVTHDNYTTIGLAAYLAEVETCRAILVGLGVSERNARFHVYTQGDYDYTLAAALQEVGYYAARAGDTVDGRGGHGLAVSLGKSPGQGMMYVSTTTSLKVDNDYNTVIGHIGTAAAVGTAFLIGHKVEAVAGTYSWVNGYDATHGFLNMLDYIAEKMDADDWQVRKFTAWYDDQINTVCNVPSGIAET